MLPATDSNRSTRSKKIAFVCLFVSILLIDIGLRMTRMYFDTDISRDAILYLHQSERISESGWDDFFQTETAENIRPPLLVSLLIAGIRLGFSAKHTGMVIVMFCGILLPVIIQRIVYESSHNAELSLWCMLAASCFPYFCRFSVEILRDGIYLFLLALFVLYAIKTYKGSYFLDSLWCGFFSMLGILNRFESVEFLFFFGTLALFCIYRHRNHRLATALRLITGYGSGIIGCLLLFCLSFHFQYSYLIRIYDEKMLLLNNCF